jgi:aminocarboxymuconate-semialdehyde decarboxylase
MNNRAIPRREFLVAISAAASAVTAAMGGASSRAQAVKRMDDEETLKVVDFHNHFVGQAFTPNVGRGAPAPLKRYFDEVNRNLADSRALLSSLDQAGVSARVVNTPLEFIQDPDADVLPGTVERINDQLADLVSRNPRRLFGLATVDAYGGDAGARELSRAVRELGLRGAFAASAKGDLFLDAPQARPTLEAAAELGVPVFAHPITDAHLRRRMGRYGRPGTTLNRGTVNSATLLALVESGTFQELPGLRIVVSTLAIGGVLLAAGFAEGKLGTEGVALLRRHVYIDTMRLNPVLLRAAVEVLGASHVLAGTDWPIYTEMKIPERLSSALAESGLGRAEQRMIASENTLKLLGVS